MPNRSEVESAEKHDILWGSQGEGKPRSLGIHSSGWSAPADSWEFDPDSTTFEEATKELVETACSVLPDPTGKVYAVFSVPSRWSAKKVSAFKSQVAQGCQSEQAVRIKDIGCEINAVFISDFAAAALLMLEQDGFKEHVRRIVVILDKTHVSAAVLQRSMIGDKQAIVLSHASCKMLPESTILQNALPDVCEKAAQGSGFLRSDLGMPVLLDCDEKERSALKLDGLVECLPFKIAHGCLQRASELAQGCGENQLDGHESEGRGRFGEILWEPSPELERLPLQKPYVVVVPSYRRCAKFLKRTGDFLARQRIDPKMIYIFVADETDRRLYDEAINSSSSPWKKGNVPHVVVGVKGIKPQRQYISDYFSEGQHIVSLDDDVMNVWERTTLKETKAKAQDAGRNLCAGDFDALIHRADDEMQKNGAYIWGLSTTMNKMHLRDPHERPLTTLGNINGFCFGYRNRICGRLAVKYGHSADDIERSVRSFDMDGVIIRFCQFCVETDCWFTEAKGDVTGIAALFNSGSDPDPVAARTAEHVTSIERLAVEFPCLIKVTPEGKLKCMFESFEKQLSDCLRRCNAPEDVCRKPRSAYKCWRDAQPKGKQQAWYVAQWVHCSDTVREKCIKESADEAEKIDRERAQWACKTFGLEGERINRMVLFERARASIPKGTAIPMSSKRTRALKTFSSIQLSKKMGSPPKKSEKVATENGSGPRLPSKSLRENSDSLRSHSTTPRENCAGPRLRSSSSRQEGHQLDVSPDVDAGALSEFVREGFAFEKGASEKDVMRTLRNRWSHLTMERRREYQAKAANQRAKCSLKWSSDMEARCAHGREVIKAMRALYPEKSKRTKPPTADEVRHAEEAWAMLEPHDRAIYEADAVIRSGRLALVPEEAQIKQFKSECMAGARALLSQTSGTKRILDKHRKRLRVEWEGLSAEERQPFALAAYAHLSGYLKTPSCTRGSDLRMSAVKKRKFDDIDPDAVSAPSMEPADTRSATSPAKSENTAREVKCETSDSTSAEDDLPLSSEKYKKRGRKKAHSVVKVEMSRDSSM